MWGATDVQPVLAVRAEEDFDSAGAGGARRDRFEVFAEGVELFEDAVPCEGKEIVEKWFFILDKGWRVNDGKVCKVILC